MIKLLLLDILYIIREMSGSRMCRGRSFFFFFSYVFSSLLRSKCSRILLAVYIVRVYRGRINDSTIKKERL